MPVTLLAVTISLPNSEAVFSNWSPLKLNQNDKMIILLKIGPT
jgi:hypothetical protein